MRFHNLVLFGNGRIENCSDHLVELLPKLKKRALFDPAVVLPIQIVLYEIDTLKPIMVLYRLSMPYAKWERNPQVY